MPKRYPNGIPAKEGFQILLEGNGSTAPVTVLQSLVTSRSICTSSGIPKHTLYLVRYFMEDTLFPSMQRNAGDDVLLGIDSDSDEAAVQEVCKKYLDSVGAKMTENQIENFADLVISFSE